MKIMFNIIKSGLIMILIHACTNLDEIVYDKIPVTEYGNTEQQANSLVGPVYKTLQNVWGDNGNLFAMSEIAGGMANNPTRRGGDGWENGNFKTIVQHSWSVRHPYTEEFFLNAYASIGICNQVIQIVQDSDMDDKETVIAEIRGVRAYWYYLLLDYFGNVPLVTDFKDTSLPKTSSRVAIYDFVLSELNEIKDVVRDDVSLASYGKFTKGAAYTLLAKMYLNAMIWNPDGGEKWAECIDACNVVMEMDYILEPDWRINFAVHNEVSQEIIFGIPYSTADGGNYIIAMTLHYLDPIVFGMNIGAWNMGCAQPEYVKAFDPDDKRLDWSFLTGPMRDPATGEILITAHGRELIHTIDINMKYGIDEDGWGQVEQEDGARIKKWEYETGLSGTAENDFAIFRLAEIYLIKAEAILRSGGDVSEATALVNQIRKRGFDDPSRLHDEVTLKDIQDERKFEFAWELKARQDGIRFGTFLDPIPGWKKQSPERNLLYPIPQRSIDQNPQLEQNPGY